MDKFVKYCEDESFVRWVLKPDNELNTFWNNYLNEHPSEKETIQTARLIVSHLQTVPSNKNDLLKESREIYSSIMNKLDSRKKKSRTKILMFSLFRYAAVGILFFAMGVLIHQYAFQQNTPVIPAINPSYSTLILSDGHNVQIPDKKSEIEYTPSGNIIINKKDTFQNNRIYTEPTLNELFVPYGKIASIKLPDGTSAFLNAGSRLVYPSEFEGDKREVSLIGEGYFKVAHNKEKPFIVRTNELNIEVLGTEFDLSAYPSDKIIETVLVNGSVKITKPGFHLRNKEYILEPNQRAAFNIETKETKITQVDVENYVAWHQGYLIFETQELNRVIKNLERYYNIRIGLTDPTLGLLRITGKLELKNDEETVLNILAKTASLDLVNTNESQYVLR